MANSGAKFMSVNLNKSYGQSSHSNYSSFGGSYGQAATARARQGSGGGGGGGMVVLSRPRSSQKTGPKLSVPPPLNLPSLRKEHERFDSSGSGGVAGSNGGPGGGPRPTSSGMGWTKPATFVSQEKDGRVDGLGVDESVDGASKSNHAYTPPLAHSSGISRPLSGSARALPSPVEKALVLRGEDFPSLQAALPVSSGSTQKQKDGVSQNPKETLPEEISYERSDGYRTSALGDMRPQEQPFHMDGNVPTKNGGEDHSLGNSQMDNRAHKLEEYFPGPLPLVRLNPRSDWADDERDTGHKFSDRGIGYSKSENYWDSDFDMPRARVLPHKPVYNQRERWSQRDNEIGKSFSNEVLKVENHHRDVRTPSREGWQGNSWRTTPFAKDQEVANDVIARTSGLNRDTWKENKYIPPRVGDMARDGDVMGNWDSAFGQRDTVHVSEGRQRWDHMTGSFNGRRVERKAHDHYSTEQGSRYRGDGLQNSTMSKSSFTSGGKPAHLSEPVVNMGPDKHSVSKSEMPYEDPYSKAFGSAGFDDSDPFSGGFPGIVKRKKDVKHTDFHDPVRESFEAELERVQKMQELERQRIVEEQERAMEQARREEEERQRLIREEGERRQRIEKEAQEAAWRAEQEQLEAIRRAEEQKIAREEERRRILMEEERRKQAAKEKLLELEARIAKRQAEAGKVDAPDAASVVDEKLHAAIMEKDVSSAMDFDNWEESERMVERITTSASFDSCDISRGYEISPRPHFAREGSSSVPDRGKSVNSWRRDMFGNGSGSSSPLNQEFGHYSPRRGALAGGRVIPRKDFYGGAGYISSRIYLKGGPQDPHRDEFGHQKDLEWNLSGDADSYHKNRELDSEFRDNVVEKYGDVGWGQGYYHGNTRPAHMERPYRNTVEDELYLYGRSKSSMRQPRVLPPPSLASVQKTSFRGANEHPGVSTFLDNDSLHSYAATRESTWQTGYYGSHEQGFERSNITDVHQENPGNENQKLNKELTPECDSQSSLSVSSPPNSPPHLSHDELDESGDSPLAPSAEDVRKAQASGNESTILNNAGTDTLVTASSSNFVVEDEEWTIENSDELQQQEEYEEDEDGYQEEDELREGDDDNLDLNQEFEDLHLEERDSSHMVDNLVLGFDDGVEVRIPSDDFERNSRIRDRGLGISEASELILENQGLIKNNQVDDQNLLPMDGSSQMSVDSSSGKIHESEKVFEVSANQLTTDPYISVASGLLAGVDASSSSGTSSHQTISSSSDDPSTTGQTTTSTLSQADLPVKLQFGLFSGPSLIPSPVPSIQIGSIQMPLHVHPPVGPSVAHIHPSQLPIFQFGQLRYTSPISQGILPMSPRSMSFVQPNVQPHYNLSQNGGGSLAVQPAQDPSKRNPMKEDLQSLALSKQPTFASGLLDQPHDDVSQTLDSISAGESVETIFTKAPGTVGDKISPKLVPQAENEGQAMQAPSLSVPNDKNFGGLKAQGLSSTSKGRRFAYTIKNSSVRSKFSAPDSSSLPRRPRRTEFRIRENGDKKQLSGLVSTNHSALDEKSNFNGRGVGIIARTGSKRDAISSKASKAIVESGNAASADIGSQEVDSGNSVGKEIWKNGLSKSPNLSYFAEGNLKRNISEEDVDAPLQSGVVRVFKQSGIEAPSDEDDFIQVRSKRQMLNDRREQREKEIKAKSRVIKPLWKSRASRQSHGGSTSPHKIFAPVDVAVLNVNSDYVASKGRDAVTKEPSTGTASQPLAPIGTPAVTTEPQTDMKSHANMSLPVSAASIVSSAGKDVGAGAMFESKDKVADDGTSSLTCWGTTHIGQQVMALTQNQLEEAMKPVQFDAHIASIGGSSTVTEPTLPSSSILMKDKSFSSSASPIDSLLAGEKIQFGAVTSPTVLPPSGHVVSHGVGASCSIQSDMQIPRNLSVAGTALFYEKDKNNSDSCGLQDCEAEAEAEAAASAVAVAAISTDDTVGNEVGSVTVSGTKSFGGADIDGIATGMAADQQLSSQSRAEEPLSVSLPADLSVETPPISLWPPLPSPQGSSNQVLSHFHGGPPSHYPFYEMNPLPGAPVFAFGPHEDSASNQSQSQKNTPSSSGPPGSWQHSMVDSFYGPPAGFTGPFISPPGGIPGVQGPPHMVVYNHFTPVGQFGQVGLSYMGTTYIPSGKQLDWKHNPTSSSTGIGEGEMKNLDMASSQHGFSNIPPPIQHLAPGSPLLRMASPVTMFDVSPFQSAPEMSVQARWSHVPASPLQSIPSLRPLQQQGEGVLTLQFAHGRPADQSLDANKFLKSQTSTSSTNGPGFTVVADTNVSRFPDDLGLRDGLSSSTPMGESTHNVADQSSSENVTADAGKDESIRDTMKNNNKGQNNSSFRSHSSSQHRSVSAQQSHSAGYSYQRGSCSSQRNTSGSDWSYRRTGYHNRNQSFNSDKGFPSAKVKQIYVAKQTRSET